jgi:3-hydroxyacyl-[acyl-carrier-protein] dehydratase
MSDDELRGFGADVIQRLIPHRYPLLMVDRVDSYRLEPSAELRASRYISANEAVFAGHFPGWSLWPGVYTIEGLGQSCMILAVLTGLFEAAAGQGVSGDEVASAIRALDQSYHLRPSRESASKRLTEALDAVGGSIGLASSIDVKLLGPVFAGQRLDYRVSRTRRVRHVQWFEVEASVENTPVARGTMGSAEAPGSASLLRR